MKMDTIAHVDGVLAMVLAAHRPIGSEEALLPVTGPFAASADALSGWVQHAAEGNVCVFARAPHAPATVAGQSRILEARGLVTLRRGRCRTDSTLFDFMARRTALPFAQARPAPVDISLSPEANRLFVVLDHVADAGAACPTLGELAAVIGVRGMDTISRLLTQLVAANLIGIEFNTVTFWRVIEILATGKRTAEQPA